MDDLLQRAAEVLSAARARSLTLATAESCTGGLIAATLTEVAGASDVVDRGFVTYSNASKMDMLGVRAETLAAHGAVSPQVAAEMAAGALARSGASMAVAVTGIAGPGGSEFKPEGRVCFALADAAGVRVETVDFSALGRGAVRRATVAHALTLMLTAMAGRTELPRSPTEKAPLG